MRLCKSIFKRGYGEILEKYDLLEAFQITVLYSPGQLCQYSVEILR